ncbi:conserved hypothetical protein [Kribbella flavida DSM 17836]|uniref:DUF1963 domain-containing protein n=1 Tax=Kribbella flavida (strain DSM 17836 / JCM 10339 / NBRC 14399) TaxID=479435 RepID=D2Q214_KRIFD|nr:hypothetical protein [Kribbella flavida]ADB33960.1 conserved hypothetical protein [Kribbella flavida DSM 17836]
MTTLMMYAGRVDDGAPGTRTGGVPLVPEGFEWPTCSSCGGSMQFLAQLFVDGAEPEAHVVSVFMCQNDPGLCEEWDPAFGGNRALVFPAAGLVPAQVPATGETLLPEASGVNPTVVDLPYEKAREQWADTQGISRREILGQLAGEPSWLQGDETPTCSSCAQPMAFVAQLEQGTSRAEINLGGGSGYTFACFPCGQAAFLWQS